MPPPISYSELRKHLADKLDDVQHRGLRIRVQRHNRLAAALVPVDDLDLLEALEEQLEADWARRALKKALAGGKKPVPAREVWKELGL